MLQPFPRPGPLVQHAYGELYTAAHGTPAEKQRLGNRTALPRPWDPASCLEPELRHQVWLWLDHVVTWLNREYTWDHRALIPTCWPAHPHLVHEIAVIADQRRTASLALTSDVLEEWHRYCLPPFINRMQDRIRSNCEDQHETWPGKPRHSDHLAQNATQQRHDTYAADVEAVANALRAQRLHVPTHRPRLAAVDLETGEVLEEPPDGNA